MSDDYESIRIGHMAPTKKYGNSARVASTPTEKRLIALTWVIACTIVFLLVRR
jgi:hypothetical protein